MRCFFSLCTTSSGIAKVKKRKDGDNVSFLSFIDHLFLHLNRKLNSSLITSLPYWDSKGQAPFHWQSPGCELYVLNLWIRLRLLCLPLSVSCTVITYWGLFCHCLCTKMKNKIRILWSFIIPGLTVYCVDFSKTINKFMLLTMWQTLN